MDTNYVNDIENMIRENVSPNNLAYISRICGTYIGRIMDKYEAKIKSLMDRLDKQEESYKSYKSDKSDKSEKQIKRPFIWEGVVYYILDPEWNRVEEGGKVDIYDNDVKHLGHFFIKDNYGGKSRVIFINEDFNRAHELNKHQYKWSHDYGKIIFPEKY